MWCLQNSCTQSTVGQSPVFISRRSTEKHCQNSVVWLHASPPACKTTSERVIRSIIPLQHPARWVCPHGCQFMPGTTQEATASPEHSDEVLTAEEDFSVLSRTVVQAFPTVLPVLHISVMHRHNWARCYQILMWYYLIIKSTRRKQCCEERSVAVDAPQRWHRWEQKRENCKDQGLPKKYSNMIDCLLFKRRLFFFNHLQLKNEHWFAAYPAFSYSYPNMVLAQAQVWPDPEAKP